MNSYCIRNELDILKMSKDIIRSANRNQNKMFKANRLMSLKSSTICKHYKTKVSLRN